MSRSTLPVVFVLAVAAVALVCFTRTSQAHDDSYGLRFVALSGEGSATKAWFEGAPPAGARVQEALDRFAKEGYRFAGIQSSFRQGQVLTSVFTAKDGNSFSSPSIPEPTFVLILERIPR